MVESPFFVQKSQNLFLKLFAGSKKTPTFASLLKGSTATGEMAEWSIAAVLKTVVLRGTGGSNPSLSAKTLNEIR